MSFGALWLRVLPFALGSLLWAGKPQYSAESIVNAASNLPGPLAPYTLASLYGADLSLAEKPCSGQSTRLCNVQVSVGGVLAVLYYVSPSQINFLVPTMWRGSEIEIQVAREGTAGPAVRVKLSDVSPAVFQLDGGTVLAIHAADWKLVTAESPARPGEDIILYATGLGPTVPDLIYPQPATGVAWIQRKGDFQLLVGGKALEGARIYYVGAAPGLAGVYQINCRLPDAFDADPELRISLGFQASPASLRLLARPASTSPQQNAAPAR